MEKLTTSNKKLEEEIKRVTESAQKRIENAEAVTRETLAACRAESEERVKKVIIECDAKVSESHVRKMPNITDYNLSSFNTCVWNSRRHCKIFL